MSNVSSSQPQALPRSPNGATAHGAKPQLQEVFVQSGVPTYTFVQPVEYSRLLVALRTAGRSIVVEGPSGIGKTTAVSKAIAESGLVNVVSLSARKKADVKSIKQLHKGEFGTVVIDDFHRLDDTTKRGIADLMKTLADEGATHSKLIVLGITNAGQSLISFGRDLANRIEVIPFETNPEYKVQELIANGERALNITLNVSDEIIRDAHGSFYLAQMLAYNTCLRANVLEAKNEDGFVTAESFHAVKAQVLEQLARSFHDTAIAFARGTKLRREGRAPYLHLLYWLSQSKNWSINAEREADRHPAQSGSVNQVVTKGFLSDLIESSENIRQVLHFDRVSNMLVAQDPQFVFYIRNLPWRQFAEEVGYISIEFPSRYDFALSFAGEDRDIAEALFEQLTDHELEVFYDFNEQHRILAEDVEDYLAPIYATEAQFVVCILGPMYPRKVWTKFESTQFKERFKAGEVVPIVLGTATVGVFDTVSTVGHLTWDRAKDFTEQLNDVVRVLLKKCAALRANSSGTEENV